MTREQLNMFGPPEDLDAYDDAYYGRHGDDAPVPSEREILWPADLAKHVGPEILTKLFGDVPRRTRLTVQEVCRRLRCSSDHVYRLVERHSLDAIDISLGELQRTYRIYRYSLVRYMFNREFIDDQGARCNLSAEELQRVYSALPAVEAARAIRRSS